MVDILSPLLVHNNQHSLYRSYYRCIIFIWNMFLLTVHVFYAHVSLISHVNNKFLPFQTNKLFTMLKITFFKQQPKLEYTSQFWSIKYYYEWKMFMLSNRKYYEMYMVWAVWPACTSLIQNSMYLDTDGGCTSTVTALFDMNVHHYLVKCVTRYMSQACD